MKLIIEIPEDSYERVMNPDKFYRDIDGEKIRWAVYKGTPIPDNATNGDSVRKMFCKGIVRISPRKNVSVEFNKKWWNSPYQKGGKE